MEWIVRTQNGRWMARYRTPAGNTKSKTWDRKFDARRWLRTEKRKMDNRTWIDEKAGDRLFEDVAETFSAARVDVRESTPLRDESYLRSLILPTFGSTSVRHITASEVQRWISDLVSTGRSPETVRKAHQILSMCLQGALQDRLIANDPCQDTRLPKIVRPNVRALEMAEVDQIADAIDPRYRAMVYCGALAGLRIGEAAALRVSSFNATERTLLITATLTQIDGTPCRTEVKTPASRQRIVLPQFLVDELELHLAGHGGGEFLFESPEGGPIRLRNWRRRSWKPAIDRSISGSFRFHELGHTHAAFLIRLGTHPKAIQSRLGHASIKTTMDLYGNLFEGTDQAVAIRLDEMLDDLAAHSTRTDQDIDRVKAGAK